MRRAVRPEPLVAGFLLPRVQAPGVAEEEAGGEMSECPWVVLDANKQEMRCERCKQAESLSLIEGKRLDFAAGIMKAFIDCHKDCTP